MYNYNICSTNPEEYNIIRCCLEDVPSTIMCQFAVNSLTANCCIEVLNSQDYIEIDYDKLYFDESYSDLNPESVADILNDMLRDKHIVVVLDMCKRFVFTRTNEYGGFFTITGCSYNVNLLLGLSNINLPLESVEVGNSEEIRIPTVGFCLLTPILYLLSNIGAKSFKNNSDDQMQSMKIVMQMDNAYNQNFPISYHNSGEYISYVKSIDLSKLEFRLVDANLHDVKLLTPMWIALTIEGIPDYDMITL